MDRIDGMQKDEKYYHADITLHLQYPLENVDHPEEIIRGLLEMPLEDLIKKCGGRKVVSCEGWTAEEEI